MSLIGTIASLAPDILEEVDKIVHLIVDSKHPSEAAAKVRRNLEMDLMDKATDAGLDAALKALHHKNG